MNTGYRCNNVLALNCEALFMHASTNATLAHEMQVTSVPLSIDYSSVQYSTYYQLLVALVDGFLIGNAL
jgi:hypothetical protein